MSKVYYKRRSKEVAELRKVEIVLSSEKWDNHFRHKNFISILSEMILLNVMMIKTLIAKLLLEISQMFAKIFQLIAHWPRFCTTSRWIIGCADLWQLEFSNWMFASALVGDSEEEFEDEEMNVDSEDVDVDFEVNPDGVDWNLKLAVNVIGPSYHPLKAFPLEEHQDQGRNL